MTNPRLAVLTPLIALTLGLAACGSAANEDAASADALPTLENTTDTSTDDDADSGDESDADAEDVDPEIAMAEYEQCLADNGIDLASSGEDGDAFAMEFEVEPGDEDLVMEDFEAAAAECDSILEDAFGEFELSPEEEAEMADQMLEMQRCLAEKGIDIETDDGNAAFQIGGDLDFDEMEAAMDECSPDTELVAADR